MKTVDFLRKHDACRDGAKWALSISKDMADVWEAMIEQGKHEWLIWAATRHGVFTESILRKLACRFVRETPIGDGRTVWDLLTDELSMKAVEVEERYADGKATEYELIAAPDAARAAGAAAYSANAARAADAYYAAYYAACAAAYYAAYYATSATRAAQSRMVAELGNPFRKDK